MNFIKEMLNVKGKSEKRKGKREKKGFKGSRGQGFEGKRLTAKGKG
jgi:hypothetical protein